VSTQAVPEVHAAPEGVAVVLGSGMSGLATAKVLSKYFSTVKVLERDSILPEWTGESAVDTFKVQLFGPTHTLLQSVSAHRAVHVVNIMFST
jgi:pyruvate/2-oxoglutarate dehydrogenase complex dihydrolipoamide dehydrogenase (E3) component